MKPAAVIFDLGGVVLDSPLDAIATYEENNRMASGSFNRLVAEAGEAGAWARLERGEITFAEFCDALEAEAAAAGLVVDAAEVMARIAATTRVRPEMVEVIRRLRNAGFKVAAVTNNWKSMRNEELAPEFDVMIESCLEGVRKPDPEIYRRALERLGVEASRTLVLDDIGRNLKTARELGMDTYKVESMRGALDKISELLHG